MRAKKARRPRAKAMAAGIFRIFAAAARLWFGAAFFVSAKELALISA